MARATISQAQNSPRRSEPWHKKWLPIVIFLGPNILGLAIFTFVPIVAGLVLSFTDWDLLSRPGWVGFDNYLALLTQDPLFWLSLKNTFIYALFVIPVGTGLALGLALLLNSGIRGASVYQAIFFLPYITSTIAIALVWQWIFHPDFGVLNSLLSLIGVPKLGWLTDRNLALVSVAIVGIWHSLGYNMVILLAGLKTIPSEYYEAARIDGVNARQALVHITLPLLSPTLLFVLTISLIGSFQVFNLVYVMTDGGPGNATLVYIYYLWENAFSFFKMGYASAMAYLLFILMLMITLLQVRLLRGRG